MRKFVGELSTAALAIIALTLVLGLAYPLVVTGIAQVAFHGKANGEQVKVNGKVIGSNLIAEPFLIGKKPNPRYFQPRPSQDSYDPAATFFSNRGPNQASARSFYRDQLAAYLRLERPYDPGLTAKAVPIDAVTTSASGVDPHISKANALIQAHRVAAVRHVSLATVDHLLSDHTDGRFLGVLGEPGVNVLQLNLALDKTTR
jgi:potassium-transporting ATPase KdpC subunit